MSEPVSHHFLPQFLMRPWADEATKKVAYFWRPHEKIVIGCGSPKSVGCDDHLYTLASQAFSDVSMIEKSVMTADIDTPAAIVHQKLLSGVHPEDLSLVERFHFAALCILLTHRRPEFIKVQQEKAEATIRDAFRNSDRTVDGVTRKMSPEEADALFDKHFAGIGKDLVLVELAKQKRASKYIMQILGLDWNVYQVPEDAPQFVLGDNPVQKFGRKEESAIDRVYLPIGPRTLFVAGSKRFFERDLELRREFIKILPLKHIMDQMALASEFVVLRPDLPPDKYLSCAEKHFASGKPQMSFNGF